ncbi:hypothetical protein B0H16DRAFT_1469087 [Mycena metata]|uniref:Uncharacterized protein n=1 Tax=Mycena metata TaxID=1033252 RepID=A0AAD7MTP2_9AGAR|nr:hypothetical protein B0H16DRAFT_1469087 [Mycena metata]
MARFISLFYAVVAAVTAASAAAVQERDSILATFFIDIDFSGPDRHGRQVHLVELAADTPDLGALGFNDLDCLDGFRRMPPQLRVYVLPDLGVVPAVNYDDFIEFLNPDLCFLCTWKVLKKLGHCPWSKMGQLIHLRGEGGGGGASVILTVLMIFYTFGSSMAQEPPLAIAAVSGHQWQRSSTKSGPKSTFAACWVRPLGATRPFRTPLILTGSCMSHKPPLAIGGQKAQPQRDSEV